MLMEIAISLGFYLKEVWRQTKFKENIMHILGKILYWFMNLIFMPFYLLALALVRTGYFVLGITWPSSGKKMNR